MLMQRASTGLFWFLSIVIAALAFVVVTLATAIGFDQAAPHLVHYLDSEKLPLYAHIVFAPLALLLAPFQFWAGLRNGHRRIHRAIGYAYAVSIAIAAIGSLLMLPRFQGSTWATTGFALLAVIWVATTARAFLLARARRIAAHRAWMMRSAALTFAAVVLRLMMLPLMATGMPMLKTYDITAWASWLLPLLVVEWLLRRPGRMVQQPV
ncbi:DUF2306 domain-containing protein [Devosia sp.]|uniref:DUF2306 domain-containing protein n=1 Tax=Devosia sp. TaxID=1871048 RepID=UPI0019F97EF1|nr:DUF2306 domain-containing protein [Devosia sp.]MBE0580379.1 DUF2306 domain-containing protein [Devosia sp.]